MSEKTGGFSEKFARRRTWKMDEGLQAVLRRLVFMGGVSSVADIGAGGGAYVRWLKSKLGVVARGYDSTPGILEISGGDVEPLDFASPYPIDAVHRADLAMCIEVGEHIPPVLLSVFFQNLGYLPCDFLLYSQAIPGQRGRDHVSCRSSEWVANKLGRYRWILMEENTILLRKIAGRGWDKKLMLFERDDDE